MISEYLELTKLVMELRSRDCFRVSLDLGGWGNEDFTFSLSISTERGLYFYDVPHSLVKGFKTRLIPATEENCRAATAWLKALYSEALEEYEKV